METANTKSTIQTVKKGNAVFEIEHSFGYKKVSQIIKETITAGQNKSHI